MKKIGMIWCGFVLFVCTVVIAAEKDIEIQGRRLISQKPPFTLTLLSELRLVHSFSQPNPAENSLTRVYFLVNAKGEQMEEMLILQIADKTNPQAGPMTTSPLKPYTEKRMYLKDRKKKGDMEIDYLIQLMAWNPDAPSLQAIVKKGVVIPSRWALQGQLLFSYQAEHAVFVRYSKDINSFGLRISEEGRKWERESISGNEKRTYELFRTDLMKMIDSISIRNL